MDSMHTVQRIAVGMALASAMYLMFSNDARRTTSRMAMRGASRAKGMADHALDAIGNVRDRMM